MDGNLEATLKKLAEKGCYLTASMYLSTMSPNEREYFRWKLRIDELVCRIIAYTGETRENIEGFIAGFAPSMREQILLRMADFASMGGNIYRAQLNDWVHKQAIEQLQKDQEEKLENMRRNVIVARWLDR